MDQQLLPPSAVTKPQIEIIFEFNTSETQKPVVAPPPQEEVASASPVEPPAPPVSGPTEVGMVAGNGKSTPRVAKHRGERADAGYVQVEISLGVGVRMALKTAAKASGMSRSRFGEYVLRRAVSGKSVTRLIEAARRDAMRGRQVSHSSPKATGGNSYV